VPHVAQPHPKVHVSFWVRELPFTLVLILILAGVAYTSSLMLIWARSLPISALTFFVARLCPFTVGGDSTSKQCYCLTKPPGRNSWAIISDSWPLLSRLWRLRVRMSKALTIIHHARYR
jgi:hypothetical protein